MSNFSDRKNLKRRVLLFFLIIFFVSLYLGNALYIRQKNINKYKLGIDQLKDKNYRQAIETLSDLGVYHDNLSYIEEASNRLLFEDAKVLYDAGRLDDALQMFKEVKDVVGFSGAKESKEYIDEITALLEKQSEDDGPYNEALNLFDKSEYEQALQIFSRLDDYKDSRSKAQECEDALLRQIRLQNATTISAGIRFSAGVTKAGKIAFSGRGYAGEDQISTWDDIVSVAVNGEFLLGLQNNGDVLVANGASGYRADTEGWKDIVAIATGQQFIVGLRKDGTLTAQGYNGYGEINIDNWHDITAISTGWQHTVGLDKGGDVFDENGNVYFAGYNSEIITNSIQSDKENWTNLIAISTGGSSKGYLGNGHVVGLKEDHTVVSAGDNSKGQCNVVGWTDIVAIAAGDFHTVGLKSDGTIVTTLKSHNDEINKFLEENPGTKFVAISAGYGTTLALTEDGTVMGAGYYTDGQLNTSSWEKVVYYN